MHKNLPTKENYGWERDINNTEQTECSPLHVWCLGEWWEAKSVGKIHTETQRKMDYRSRLGLVVKYLGLSFKEFREEEKLWQS